MLTFKHLNNNNIDLYHLTTNMFYIDVTVVTKVEKQHIWYNIIIVLAAIINTV